MLFLHERWGCHGGERGSQEQCVLGRRSEFGSTTRQLILIPYRSCLGSSWSLGTRVPGLNMTFHLQLMGLDCHCYMHYLSVLRSMKYGVFERI